MTHAFTWVELPSNDFDRAVEFYSTVLDGDIDVYSPDSDDAPTGRAGMFPADEGEVGGMIVEADEYTTESGATIRYTPTAEEGPVVYLSVRGELDDVLSRVESGGGDVVVPKEPIPEMGGHYAIITDTEGNRVGLMTSD